MATSSEREPQVHVLVVDDDPDVAEVLRQFLAGHGFAVRIATSGAEAREAIRQPRVDVVLLDLGLPDGNGLALLADLRLHWGGPLIIVSGQGAPVERALGLELGADDFVSKPFDLRELLARIRSVLRRTSSPATPAQLAFDDLVLDTDARRLQGRNGADIDLTSGEYALLVALLERPRQVLSRDQLLGVLHGREAGPFDRAIDMQVGRLRRKVERDPAEPTLIQSVRGAGYLLAASVEKR